MAYSLVEQISRDLDVFLFDETKIIHIATAGGVLPEKIASTEINFDKEIYTINSYRRIFNYKRNDSLIRNNLVSKEFYFRAFERMSKRGFYSYDKVYIDDSENQIYQLISYPIYDRQIKVTKFDFLIQPNEIRKYGLTVDLNLIKTSKQFQVDFDEFDLFEYI